MEPTIVDKGEMLLVGMVDYGGVIGTLWEAFIENDRLVKHVVEGNGYELHAYPPGFEYGDPFYCFVGVEVTDIQDMPDFMFAKVLPPGTYAVFTHRLADGGYEGANAPIDKWMRTGPYDRAHDFDLQVYGHRFKGPDNPESELDFYIPVKPKQ
jgi:AraC family transcriptional regulator